MPHTEPQAKPRDAGLEPRYWKLGHWLYALLFAISPKRRVDGVAIAVAPVGDGREAAFQRVEQALREIAAHDPRSYSRLRAHVPRIWVGPIPNYARGQWIEELRLCMLRDSFVGAPQNSTAYIAAVLVHEVTHARLLSRGVGFEEHVRPQVERLCTRAQLAFLRKHPDGAGLISMFAANLSREDSWWSDARLRAVQLRAIKKLGTPRRLRWALDRATRGRLLGGAPDRS